MKYEKPVLYDLRDAAQWDIGLGETKSCNTNGPSATTCANGNSASLKCDDNGMTASGAGGCDESGGSATSGTCHDNGNTAKKSCCDNDGNTQT